MKFVMALTLGLIASLALQFESMSRFFWVVWTIAVIINSIRVGKGD